MAEGSQMEVAASEEQGDVMLEIDTVELLLQKRRVSVEKRREGRKQM